MNVEIYESTDELAWELDHSTPKHLAKNLLDTVQNRIGLYSNSIKHLYFQYEYFYFWPDAETVKALCIPKQSAYHEIFTNIPEEAVCYSGIKLIPGEAIKRSGVHIVFRKRGQAKVTALPLKEGIRQLMKMHRDDNLFLPVLTKDSFGRTKNHYPELALFRLNLEAIHNLSKFQLDNLKSTICKQFVQLYRDAEIPVIHQEQTAAVSKSTQERAA